MEILIYPILFVCFYQKDIFATYNNNYLPTFKDTLHVHIEQNCFEFFKQQMLFRSGVSKQIFDIFPLLRSYFYSDELPSFLKKSLQLLR